MKKIIFNNPTLCIMTPAIDIDIKILADKDVPAGVLYKIIDASELPTDRSTRNFWEYGINESNADGKGLTKKEFADKYPEYKDWAVQ
jgi:hypothetical protein